jgi:hypothetical protein
MDTKPLQTNVLQTNLKGLSKAKKVKQPSSARKTKKGQRSVGRR